MGFIGLGGQGAGHLLGGAWTYVPGGYVARKDVQVVAVCDVRQERREHAWQRSNAMYAQRYNQPGYDGVSAYRDFREVLARPDIDAVLLAQPYHWAAPMATMALRSGKDVYCEKPMAITVREGLNLEETCRRYGRVYQAGTQQRSEYGGKFRLACELVRNGRIGRLQEVYAYRQPGAFFPTPWTSDESQPVPAGFDWDLWLGPLPWRPFNGEAGHALPGHFVGDVNWSPHHYDFVHWVVNPDPAAPVEVAYEGRSGSAHDAIVHYHYAHGVVVHSSGYPGEPVGRHPRRLSGDQEMAELPREGDARARPDDGGGRLCDRDDPPHRRADRTRFQPGPELQGGDGGHMGLAGRAEKFYAPTVRASLTRNISSRSGRTDYVRIKLEKGADGLLATPVLGRSGMLRTLAEANGLLVVPAAKEGLNAGDTVEINIWE